MMYIKNLERNKYWKQNKFGYTSDLNDAGQFDEEESIEICREANKLGRVNDISLIEEEVLLLDELGSISEPYKKRNIDIVLGEITSETFFESNPISHVIGKLIDDEYYPTQEFDNLRNFGESISYNETFDKNIEIAGERGLFVKMSIYRNEKGTYELTAYKNEEPEIKSKKKRSPRLKP